MSANLKIDSDDLRDIIIAVETLGGAIKGPDLLKIAGASMEETTREHLRELARDSEHHTSAFSLGAEPTGFYEKAAEAVAPSQLEDDGVSVSIDHEGLAQRFYGGTIEAKPGSFLTIPATADAYGHRAKEFHDLRLIIFPDTELAALVERDNPHPDEGSVYYWLVRHVHQPGDPSVLPTDPEILDPVMERVQSYIGRVWDERKAA